NTTSDVWNYTLPNLLEILDGLLDGGQPHNNPILQNPNKATEIPATTLWNGMGGGGGVWPISSPEPLTTSTSTSPPINKPMFALNFTLRTTIETLLKAQTNFSLLEPLRSGSSGNVIDLELETPNRMGNVNVLPPSTIGANNDILYSGNDSLVTLDDTFWLSANESRNFSQISGNDTMDGPIVDTVGMVITSVILGIMILTTVI
ncbi:hypothetical protein SK128_021229, partial [Halocaridina rubra]